MKGKHTPGMYDTNVSFGGIRLEVDPIDRPRTESDDNVMAVFYEEQPFMWEFTKDRIGTALREVDGEIDFLDVGTGSGVWSILVSKNLEARNILAIDKSERAVNWAMSNAIRNRADINLRREFYNISTAPHKSCKVIGIYAPYHLYPSEIESDIPQHARGGVDGQQVFKEQLTTATYHLADNGIVVFNQMCLGRDGKPDFVDYIPRIMEGCSLEYTNIFPPTNSGAFLWNIYGEGLGERFRSYVDEIHTKTPQLFYCDGIITRDGGERVEEIEHNISLEGRSWHDRLKLHFEIARHGLDSAQRMKGGKK